MQVDISEGDLGFICFLVEQNLKEIRKKKNAMGLRKETVRLLELRTKEIESLLKKLKFELDKET